MAKLILPGSPEFNDPFGEEPDTSEAEPNESKPAPKGPLPAGAIDSRMCIIGPQEKHPWRKWDDAAEEPGPAEASVEQYRDLQGLLGSSRAVLHQPSGYGFDNSCLLSALEELSSAPDGESRGCAKGFAAIGPDTSESELLELTDAGCVGAKFSMAEDAPILDWQDLDRLAWRLHDYNWLISLRMDGRYFHEVEQKLADWPGPIVIEHMGGFPELPRTKDQGFRAMLRLIDKDGVWVDVSGWDESSHRGPPHFEDVADIASALLNWAPERMLWSSNWPHMDNPDEATDDLAFLKVFRNWCPNEAGFQAAVKTNPELLFGFSALDGAAAI